MAFEYFEESLSADKKVKSVNLATQSINTLRILLGFALAGQKKILFELLVKELGRDIGPFSNDF